MKQTKKQRKQEKKQLESDQRLAELNEQMQVHLKALAGHTERPEVELPDHQFKDNKLFSAMQNMQNNEQQDPMLKLLADAVQQFKQQHQREPVAVKMPMQMLLHIVGMLDKALQEAFWNADVKRLAGLLVGTTEDGTLVLK